MSTWHQDRNPIPEGHPELWTVISNPPHRMKTASLFNTEEEAYEYLERLQNYCPIGIDVYLYVVPPTG